MKITIKNFQKKIPINPKRIKKTILEVLSKETAKKSGEITICFVNDKKIKELNLKFLHKNSPTDVLAFDGSTSSFDKLRTSPERSRGTLTINPQACRRIDMRKTEDRGKGMLADIIISTDTASRNSRAFKTSVLYELHLYLVHGLLHLLGYDDRNRKQRQLMQKKEREYVDTQNPGPGFK